MLYMSYVSAFLFYMDLLIGLSSFWTVRDIQITLVEVCFVSNHFSHEEFHFSCIYFTDISGMSNN